MRGTLRTPGPGKDRNVRQHRRIRYRGQAMLAGALGFCLLAGAPAANAAFARTVNAGTLSVGTYRLAAPAGNTVSTDTCSATGASGKYKMTVTATGHGTVANATGYVLTIRDKDGVVKASVPFTAATPNPTYSTVDAAKGWGYTIDAQRQFAPGNVWTSISPVISRCL